MKETWKNEMEQHVEKMEMNLVASKSFTRNEHLFWPGLLGHF